MQRTAAKSVDGVNIKSTTCRVTLWWCDGGRLGTLLPVLDGNEAGGGGVLLQTTSTG